MAKTKISDYSTSNASNTDINSINIDEGCAPSGINNAIRELMVHLKNFQTGASSDPMTVGGAFVASSTATLNGTSIPANKTLADTDSSQTLTNKTISGSANTITNVSLTSGITGTLGVTNGGTGQTTFSSGEILIGNASGGLTKTTITQGSNISITNGNGSITIAATGVGTGDVTTTGTQTLSNKTLVDPIITGTILEDVYTISDGAAFEIDPGNGSIQLITLGASRTPKATNFAAGEAVTLMVDDGTAYTLTWTDATFGGSGVVWKTDSGVAPTLNTSGYTVITLWKVGTQVYGARVGNAQ